MGMVYIGDCEECGEEIWVPDSWHIKGVTGRLLCYGCRYEEWVDEKWKENQEKGE